MPWHKVHGHSACSSSKPWAVVKDSDGSVEGCHTTETAANRQLAALHASEVDKVHIRLGPTVDLCLECGEPRSLDGVLKCACPHAPLVKAADRAGAMIAVYPRQELARELAVDGGEPRDELHVTLAYLGKAVDLDIDALSRMMMVLPAVAARTPAFTASGGGLGQFPPGDDGVPVWMPVSAHALNELRNAVCEAAHSVELAYATNHGWVPHMTLAYVPEPQHAIEPVPPVDVPIDAISLVVAGHRIDYMFADTAAPDGFVLETYDEETGVTAAVEFPDVEPDASFGVYAPAAGALRKNAEKRFTFGPMYVPDQLDAHGEFSTADDLQQAVWNYVRSADRRIRLQHNREVVAGELVECAVWPYESEVELLLPQDDGSEKVEKVTLPANTPFLGVVWEPRAWDLVKKGKLRGYSIGGRARRVYADLPA